MKVICIGHIAYDLTFPVSRIPEENTKIRTTHHIECGGGPMRNAALPLACWHSNVELCGMIGNDYQGEQIINELKHLGIGTKYIVKRNDIPTDQAVILATTNGTRTIVTSVKPKEHPLIKISENFDGILIDGEEYQTSQQVLKNNKTALSIIDAGKYNSEVISLAHKVNVVACSKEFAEKFSQEKIDPSNLEQLKNIHRKLENEFKNIVIITLEEYGSFTKIGNEYKLIPSMKVNTVDSSGAGDIFHGALLYFMLMNYSLEDSIKLSNICGALATTRLGNKDFNFPLTKILKYGGVNDII